MDKGKYTCGIFIDLKKHLIQLITISFCVNSIIMVSEIYFMTGLNLTYLIANKLCVLMGRFQILN